MTKAAYPNIFQSIRLGPIELRNRIVIPAHTTNFGRDNLPTDVHVAYHEARARGGVGLIIFESIRVHRSTLGKFQGIAGYDSACVEPLRRVADAVHSHGARLIGQVISLGRQVDGDAARMAPWGPSPVRWSIQARPARTMDETDIASIVEGHVTTSHNLLEAGLDGLEIHLGHGHLLQQFLSPASNHRTDAYGGSEENRLRFPLEVLRAVRTAVGPDVCMGIRVSGDEYLDGGLQVSDMERILPSILDEVHLDFVNISHSAYHASVSLSTQMADMEMSAAPFRHVTRRITRAIRGAGYSVPTIAVCKIRSLAEADAIVARGDADLVGIARAHIADPDLVRKSLEGREDEIRPCIGCNQGCAGFLERSLPITCLVNPTVGREQSWPEPSAVPAPQPRRVLVVGAGPAGLEAAWVAAARGHDVEVWEREAEVGGAWRWLRTMPLRHDALALIEYQTGACHRNGVRIRTGREATLASVGVYRPQVVVVATGATPSRLRLPDGAPTLTLQEALEAPWRIGPTVALLDLTGEWAALSVVEHLARLGHQSAVVTPAPSVGWQITRYSAFGLFDRLRSLSVSLHPLRRAMGHASGTLTLQDVSTGLYEALPFDSVIGADYGTSRDELASPLREAGFTVRIVGDAVTPRTGLEAVFEGHEVGRAL